MKASAYVQLGFWSDPVRSVVRSLNRFCADKVRDNASAYAWGSSDEREKSGKIHSVSYEAWLRWYTPLCERGQG